MKINQSTKKNIYFPKYKILFDRKTVKISPIYDRKVKKGFFRKEKTECYFYIKDKYNGLVVSNLNDVELLKTWRSLIKEMAREV